MQTLRYQDEKSDKFWRVETSGCEKMTNWGKAGTSGRYGIKEFETEKDKPEPPYYVTVMRHDLSRFLKRA